MRECRPLSSRSTSSQVQVEPAFATDSMFAAAYWQERLIRATATARSRWGRDSLLPISPWSFLPP